MKTTDIEFLSLIFVRKLKTLFLRTRTLTSERYLARKKSKQKVDFYKLSKNFNSYYHATSHFSFEKFVTPLWKNFNDKAVSSFIPEPSFSFLNDGTIMLTMFGGSSFDEEIAYLEKHYKKSELSRLLLEDYVGNPLIVSNKYITSFNSVRQLYLLSFYFKKAKLSPDTLSMIVEWGGGYGNMAKLVHRMSARRLTYVMTDTPLFCCIQWLYLSTIYGAKQVRLITSPNDRIRKGVITIIPIGLLDSYTNQLRADLFISTWGLSESSKFSQDFVAKRKWFGAKHIFLGYQKSSKNLPTAEYVGELAEESGAKIETLSILPNNSLAIK